MNTAPSRAPWAAGRWAGLLGALSLLTGCRTVELNDAPDESPPTITVSITGIDMRVAYGDLIPNTNWSGTHRGLLRDGMGFRHGFIDRNRQSTVIATATDADSGIKQIGLRVLPQGWCRIGERIGHGWTDGDFVPVIGGAPPPGPGDRVPRSRTASVTFRLADFGGTLCEVPEVTHVIFEARALNHQHQETWFQTRTFP